LSLVPCAPSPPVRSSSRAAWVLTPTPLFIEFALIGTGSRSWGALEWDFITLTACLNAGAELEGDTRGHPSSSSGFREPVHV
jgi:hypothetical protein